MNEPRPASGFGQGELSMQNAIQVGTILMKDGPLMTQLVGLASEPFAGSWSRVNLLNGFDFDRRVHASGWTFFFLAAEVKATYFGALGINKIRAAVKRILGKVEHLHFNGLEVTGISTKHLFGIPYTVVTAHSRHVQQGSYLDNIERRQAS
jgi:hypothetical protein